MKVEKKTVVIAIVTGIAAAAKIFFPGSDIVVDQVASWLLGFGIAALAATPSVITKK